MSPPIRKFFEVRSLFIKPYSKEHDSGDSGGIQRGRWHKAVHKK